MNENNLVVIREYDSINDAEWNKSILEGEGIYAMIRNEIMSALSHRGYARTTRRTKPRQSKSRRDFRGLHL